MDTLTNTIIVTVITLLIILIMFYKSRTDTVINNIHNTITVAVSQLKTVIAVNGKIIINSNRNQFLCVVLNSKYEVKSVTDYLNTNTDNDDTVIITSNIKHNFSFTDKQFLKNSVSNVTNYLFIGSKKDGKLFESVEPVIYYPQMQILESECVLNEIAFNTVKTNTKTKFNTHTVYTPIDPINSCAIESYLQGNTRFGLSNNNCFSVSDSTYENSVKLMKRSDECVNTLGSPCSVSVYKFGTLDKVNNLSNNSVIFCEHDKCYMLTAGKHSLHPDIFMKVLLVKLGKDVKRVTLYSDINFTDVVQTVENSVYTEYPLVVRSVIIL